MSGWWVLVPLPVACEKLRLDRTVMDLMESALERKRGEEEEGGERGGGGGGGVDERKAERAEAEAKAKAASMRAISSSVMISMGI